MFEYLLVFAVQIPKQRPAYKVACFMDIIEKLLIGLKQDSLSNPQIKFHNIACSTKSFGFSITKEVKDDLLFGNKMNPDRSGGRARQNQHNSDQSLIRLHPNGT